MQDSDWAHRSRGLWGRPQGLGRTASILLAVAVVSVSVIDTGIAGRARGVVRLTRTQTAANLVRLPVYALASTGCVLRRGACELEHPGNNLRVLMSGQVVG